MFVYKYCQVLFKDGSQKTLEGQEKMGGKEWVLKVQEEYPAYTLEAVFPVASIIEGERFSVKYKERKWDHLDRSRGALRDLTLNTVKAIREVLHQTAEQRKDPRISNAASLLDQGIRTLEAEGGTADQLLGFALDQLIYHRINYHDILQAAPDPEAEDTRTGPDPAAYRILKTVYMSEGRGA